MLHPILLDGRPPYMPVGSAMASLLLAPVGQRPLIAALADALPLNGQSLTVLSPFVPDDEYTARIREACPSVRRVAAVDDFPFADGIEAADWVLFVDARYGIVDTQRVEMMLRDVSRVRGKAIHLVAMARHAGGTRERVELATDGRVRRIQRYYDAATWPFLDAVVCSLVSAAALRRVSDPPRSGGLDLLRLSLMMLGVPSRDIQAEGALFDLHREADLLRLNERAVLQSRERAEPSISATAHIHPTARVLGHVVVHDGARIDANAVVVGPGVIAPGAHIGGDAVVTHCVVGAETDVPAGSVLRSRALFGRFAAQPAIAAPAISEPLEVADAVAEPDHAGSIYLHVKAAIDALIAAAALIVLSPLLLLIAVLIKLDSRGSIFFADLREGQHGRLFPCFKFRTMVTGSHARQQELATLNDVDGPQFKLEKDPRLTRVGRWLRPASLDELPQLFNIIRGEMSLIGPRPSPFRENQTCVPWRDARLSVRPGITGLWQVCRHDRRDGDFHQWIYFDLLYVKHVSPLVDIKIALATILTRGGQTHVSVDRIIPPGELAR